MQTNIYMGRKKYCMNSIGCKHGKEKLPRFVYVHVKHKWRPFVELWMIQLGPPSVRLCFWYFSCGDVTVRAIVCLSMMESYVAGYSV